jgi:hypothetical protein
MDRKLQNIKRHRRKPSKLLTSLALLAVFFPSFFLIKNLSYRHKDDYTQHSISLPKLKKIYTVDDEDDEEESAQVKDNEWQTIKPNPGDSMAIIFNRLGLSAKNLHEVLYKNPHEQVLTTIKPNQQLQFLISKHIQHLLTLNKWRLKTNM